MGQPCSLPANHNVRTEPDNNENNELVEQLKIELQLRDMRLENETQQEKIYQLERIIKKYALQVSDLTKPTANHNVRTEPDNYENNQFVEQLQAELREMRLENANQQETINQQAQTIQKYDLQVSEITKTNKAKEAEFQDRINQLNRSVQTNLQNSVNAKTQLEAEKNRSDAVIAEMKATHRVKEAELQIRLEKSVTTESRLKAEKSRCEANLIEAKRRADKLQQENARLNNDVINLQTNFKDQFQAATRQMQDRLKIVLKENKKLTDPNRICLLKDIIVNGKVDYIYLNGKILMVKKLEYDNDKWIADDQTDISFKNSNFQLCTHNELVLSGIKLSDISNRVFYSNVTKLCLANMVITFDEYKEMSTCNIKCLKLHGITVNDKHGITMDIANLLKEVPNIEKFGYIFKENEAFPIQKLVQLPSFPMLQQFNLSEMNEAFDLKLFVDFIKNNPSVNYELWLRCSDKFYGKLKNAEKVIVPSTYKLKIMHLKN